MINDEEKFLLLKTVQEKQVLPLTSACGLDCLFCSHKQNPPGVKTYTFGHLDLTLIKELIDYLPQQGAVTIGESATRIIEGEPLLHPHFRKVIDYIRKKFPEKEIIMTTSGNQLDYQMVQFLKKQKKIEINLSLNFCDISQRSLYMRDHQADIVFKALGYLQEAGLVFNGSIVALLARIGEKRLRKTISLLEEYGANTVRVFAPGVTRYSSKEMKEEIGTDTKLNKVVPCLKKQFSIPVIKEPSVLTDFNKEIQGISKDSPAEKAGLQTFDIIKEVNGQAILTRVDVFRKIVQLKDPQLTIKRKKEKKKIIIKKEKNEKPGFVLDFDLAGEKIEQLKKMMKKYQDKSLVLATSQLAAPLMKKLLEMLQIENPGLKLVLLPVKNYFFGGNIKAAGLLTTEDIMLALKDVIKGDEVLIMPGIIYDFTGRDLKGDSYRMLEDEFEIKVELID